MEEISTSLVNFLEAFTERGMTVLALQLLLMAAAGVTAFFIHRHSQKTLVERLKSKDISRVRGAVRPKTASSSRQVVVSSP